MKHFTTALLLVAALGVTACSKKTFDDTGFDDGATSGFDQGTNGIIPGSANDPTSVAYFQQTVGDRVLFVVDQSDLTPDSQQTLRGQAQWLLSNPDYLAVIEGHADEQGTRQYNIALGARRANAVMEFITSQGVPASRMKFISYGKERPAELCSEEACYSKNRRAVTIISAGGLTG